MGDYEAACCVKGCHGRVCLSAAVYQRARETHETFYCSAGHRQHFTAETEKERRIRELEATVRRLQQRVEFMDEWNTTLANRLHRCRWVGCDYQGSSTSTYDFRDLHTHMRAAHGMPTLGQVRAAESEAS